MEKGFEQIFIDNYPRVKSFALRILMSEEDAEDVAQDIFIKILGMPEVWQKEGGIDDSFLFTITRNHVFNIIKRRSLERKYQVNLYKEAYELEEFGIEDNLYAKEINLISTYVVEQMPDQRRKVFKMSRLYGKNTAEIADELNISKRTVERHIYMALSELKKILLLFLFFIE